MPRVNKLIVGCEGVLVYTADLVVQLREITQFTKDYHLQGDKAQVHHEAVDYSF